MQDICGTTKSAMFKYCFTIDFSIGHLHLYGLVTSTASENMLQWINLFHSRKMEKN